MMNDAPQGRSLTTADFAAVAEMPRTATAIDNDNADTKRDGEQLAPLFLPEAAATFRSRWNAVQSSFVDDPGQAVKQGDELVAEVMKTLAETFANERAKLEGQIDRTAAASTEDLRVALRRYRSFFERLLSL
jgi:hypothetical protein